MELSALTAISPVDGRYRRHTEMLDSYFSEYGLMRYRVLVEIEYFIFLASQSFPQLPAVTASKQEALRLVYRNFSAGDALLIKEKEAVTNHDVKAVEYFVKEQLASEGLSKYSEFVHFALTSQDINNTAIPLSLKEATAQVILPALERLLDKLKKMSSEHRDTPMLARTHGQPASPTRLGKEIRVFIDRLGEQIRQLKSVPFSAKFGGATGNFNAHLAAYPQHDWVSFAEKFVNEILGLSRSKVTTQVEHYDNLAAYCDALKRVNTILLDLCRDMWTYVSMDYFKQKLKAGEVGSSAMPHKVNPIDFENAEGNIGLANALFEHIASKLPVSRLQRDLSDSTVLRSLGTPVAYSLIAYASMMKGLEKLLVNREAIEADLDGNWAVVAEGIQTILRREGYPQPYEALKALTRTNATVTRESLNEFIRGLKVSDEVKNELSALTPHNYTGIKFSET
jgi:adenylosuccinate lyase